MLGQSLSSLKNKVFTDICNNQNIIKALVIEDKNFLTVSPTSEQLEILNNPTTLIRNQLYPYQYVSNSSVISKTYITTSWNNFKKNKSLWSGIVNFYIFVPLSLERTIKGIRYDYIADQLETMFIGGNLGEFSLSKRDDLAKVNDSTLVHSVSFNITDFHIPESGDLIV